MKILKDHSAALNQDPEVTTPPCMLGESQAHVHINVTYAQLP